MTFAQAFFTEVASRYTGSLPLYFQQALSPTRPYCVMLIVPPAPETPNLMCEDQGDGGELNLQWSVASDSGQAAYNDLEAVKQAVQPIVGYIGTAPDRYNVIANRTGGVVSLDAQLGTWSAIFESVLAWSIP